MGKGGYQERLAKGPPSSVPGSDPHLQDGAHSSSVALHRGGTGKSTGRQCRLCPLRASGPS